MFKTDQDPLNEDESIPASLKVPDTALWVTSVGPNFAKVFAIVRRIMGVSPGAAKALLNGPPFQVAVGWPADLKDWRDDLLEAGATAEIR
jgi:hypothetical protein